jgi:hydroxymethylbilane synthase
VKGKPIIIGSRGSDLALWQANHIKDRLEKLGHTVEIKIIKTQGDIIQHLAFDKMEGKGFFTKELESALLDGSIDLAVHSCKDLETNQPEGLTIAAISERAAVNDLLLIRKDFVDPNQKWKLAAGALVGTSSTRRKMQLRHHRPDLRMDDIRGNVPTRINKLRAGQFHAIVLAQAGLDRLNLDVSDLEAYPFDPTAFIPAPAQGVLACQIRDTDSQLRAALSAIHDPGAASLIEVERKVLNLFHGGCQLPLGAYCRELDGTLELHAVMAPTWQDRPIHVVLSQKSPEGFAEKAVEALKLQRV